MCRIYKLIKPHKYLILLTLMSLIYLAVTIRINHFKYYNFDYGKFDLGNMTQMVWNASQGRGLYLTDYFGTNLPRWAMSHVDPILYIFVPIFMVFPSPLTLVYAQLVLVIASALLVFKIAQMHLKSDLAAFFLGVAFLFNPSIGYLTATTGFHGVTAVIPFFLGAFYVFEKMYYRQDFSRRNIVIFSTLALLTMMGKEQIALYTFIYGLFILILRNEEAATPRQFLSSKSGRVGLVLSAVSLIWFITAFFIIIPANAHYRVEGFEKFVKTIEISGSSARDVAKPNYFLNRYEEFGDSYFDIILGILADPEESTRIFFGGDKSENFDRTFQPFAYLPFAYPAALLMAVPDLIINFLTTADGIGTAEITNHRISMILPVLAVASILGIKYLAGVLHKKRYQKRIVLFLTAVVVIFTFYTTSHYNNPVYLWMRDAVKNKVLAKVFAKYDQEIIKQNLQVGDIVKLSELEFKDVDCARKIVKTIPKGASISGPDSLGAHLALRETYAIFPALYNEADYVIVDVFAKKIFTILDLNTQVITDVIEKLIKNPNYELKLGCGNYFVFQNLGAHNKADMLPIQERFTYNEKFDYKFFQSLEVVDFKIPSQFKKGEREKVNLVYYRSSEGSVAESSLEDYRMFITFVNSSTGEIYQMANLASFALREPGSWEEGRYYLEDIEVVMPEFIENGDHLVFVGMGNSIRTRSMFLGVTKVF